MDIEQDIMDKFTEKKLRSEFNIIELYNELNRQHSQESIYCACRKLSDENKLIWFGTRGGFQNFKLTSSVLN